MRLSEFRNYLKTGAGRKEGLDMKRQVTEELLEKMKAAKTAEQMFEITREQGLDLTKEKAKEYFEILNQGG